MMIKLADDNVGSVEGRNVRKGLTADDSARLAEAIAVVRDILRRLGVPEDSMVLGTINGGHPGGMLPLTEREVETFHDRRLPDNLYVADATLFPKSLGNPPILTIMAMAKRVGRICNEQRALGRL